MMQKEKKTNDIIVQKKRKRWHWYQNGCCSIMKELKTEYCGEGE